MRNASMNLYLSVMERYRSGHNEAVLKTVCPQGRVGSNPTLSAGENDENQLTKMSKNLKKYLTNKNEYDKIFELTYELATNLKRQNALWWLFF